MHLCFANLLSIANSKNCYFSSGLSWESNPHKHAYITDVILNVLEDVQNIKQKLCSVTSKLDRAVSILSEAKLGYTEANIEAKEEDIVICANTTIQDNLVHSQASSEDP